MTKLTRPAVRETGAKHRGTPIVIELQTTLVFLRTKHGRENYSLRIEDLYEMAAIARRRRSAASPANPGAFDNGAPQPNHGRTFIHMTKKTATEQHEQVRTIALTQLRSSTYNPRRTFNESKLDELAESIRAVGLIQPIVARPVEDDAYQIVAGERRYRAALRAGLTEVLVHTKPLTEAQAREITLVENAQREDVHPYEEAAALKSLLELPGYDVPAVASKIGRSVSHVYARLQLANLTPDIADAFLRNEITPAHAVLIARLPQEHQAEAFQHAFDRYGDSAEERQLLPARDLRAWIERKLFLRLDGSPFDREDATLLPEAGACLACSKRSGANGALFEDVTEDCCLDRTCWNAKVDASVQRSVEAKPELVQIATDYYLDREDDASDTGEAWERSDYTLLSGDDADDDRVCEYAEDAVVAVGKDKGQSAKICRNPECPIHGSPSQEQAERDEERNAEQKRKQREQKQKLQKRQALYRSILDAVSFPPTADQFRFFTGVIIQGNAYRLRGFLEAHNLLGKGEKRSPLDVVREHLQVSEPAAVARFAVSFLLYEAATNSYIDRADETLAEAAAAFKAKPAEKTKRAKSNTRARHTAKRARPKRKSRKGAA